MVGKYLPNASYSSLPSQEKQPRHGESLDEGHKKVQKGCRRHALILFVSLPDDDGRRPTYSVFAHPSSSDCSSLSASGDDDMMATAKRKSVQNSTERSSR